MKTSCSYNIDAIKLKIYMDNMETRRFKIYRIEDLLDHKSLNLF